ncbi:carbohydrate ABC transporter permease [Fusibacter bizertensis]
MRMINKKKNFNMTKIIVNIILMTMVIGVAYPLIWTLLNSLKGNKEFYVNNFGFPQNPLWSNYVKAWKRGIGTYYLNSFFVTAVTVIVSTFIAALAAYGLSRFDFKWKKIIFYSIVGGLLISQQVATISLYEILKAMKIYDTYLAMILPYIAFRIPFSVFFMYPYFKSFPKEIEEAAILDGCSNFGIFMRVVIPISKPIIASCGIMAAMFSWNEFIFALIFVESESLYTIPIGLMAFRDALSTDWGPLLAGIILATVPIIIFFVFLQKYFIAGMTEGSSKG